MSVIVDTTAWSAAFRRAPGPLSPSAREVVALVDEGRVELLGAVRQEVLSGVRAKDQFRRLRDRLRAFEDLALDNVDYENAGACFNECRGKGVQGSNTDFLICAVALRRDLAVFTADGDFPHFKRILGVRLHSVRSEFTR